MMMNGQIMAEAVTRQDGRDGSVVGELVILRQFADALDKSVEYLAGRLDGALLPLEASEATPAPLLPDVLCALAADIRTQWRRIEQAISRLDYITHRVALT